MELRQYLKVLKKWLWLIILVALVAGGASYYATSQMPKLYQSVAKVMVGESYQKADATLGDVATGAGLADTYIQLIETSAVLRAVKEKLGLPNSIGELRAQVSGNAIPRTQFLEVRATDTDPRRAALLANAVAEQLILLGPASSNEDVIQHTAFVREQIQDLETKINSAEVEIGELEESLKTTTSVREATDKRSEIDRLRAQIAQYQQNYTQFITYLAPSSRNTLSVLEPAEPANAPFSPNFALNIPLAAIIGVILAIGVAFLIEYLDDTLKTKEDVARVLNASTIGEIGMLRNRNDNVADQHQLFFG
jgi:capsular polysaccharide biosynthesis protein